MTNGKKTRKVVQGSQIAAAHVAGAAITVLARNYGANPYQVFEYIIKKSKTISFQDSTDRQFLYLDRWSLDENSTINAQSSGAAAEESECFPGEAMAQVYGRGAVSMASLQAGDLVQVKRASGDIAHEPVLGFLHSIHSEETSFVSVTHSKGQFRASANHLVFISQQLDKPVGDLEVGDQILADSMASTVLAIHRAFGQQGMYAPLTETGTVVVDGVAASNYAVSSLDLRRVPHACAHAIFAPVRLYHKLGFAAPKETADGLHPFLGVVYRQLRLDSVVALL